MHLAVIHHVCLDSTLLVAREVRLRILVAATHAQLERVAAGNIGNNASLRNKNTHAKRVPQLKIVVSVLSGQLALEHKQQTFNVHYVQILSHVTADSIGYLAMDRARLLQHAQFAHP